MSEVTHLAGAMSRPQHPQTLPTENNMMYHDVRLATPELLRTYWRVDSSEVNSLSSESRTWPGLVEDALSAIILTENIDAALSSLRDSLDRLVMGAPKPRLPVQPTQVRKTQIQNKVSFFLNIFKLENVMLAMPF